MTPNRTRAEQVLDKWAIECDGKWNPYSVSGQKALNEIIEQALDEAVRDAKIEAYNDLKYTDAALEKLSNKSVEIGRKEGTLAGLEMCLEFTVPYGDAGREIANEIRSKIKETGGDNASRSL